MDWEPHYQQKEQAKRDQERRSLMGDVTGMLDSTTSAGSVVSTGLNYLASKDVRLSSIMKV